MKKKIAFGQLYELISKNRNDTVLTIGEHCRSICQETGGLAVAIGDFSHAYTGADDSCAVASGRRCSAIAHGKNSLACVSGFDSIVRATGVNSWVCAVGRGTNSVLLLSVWGHHARLRIGDNANLDTWYSLDKDGELLCSDELPVIS